MTAIPVPLVSLHGSRVQIGEQGDGKMWLDGKSLSFPSSANYVAGGSTQTLSPATNGSRTTLFDTLAGTVLTLPAATGSGHIYKFYVSVLATSNSHKLQVANAADFFIGIIETMSDDPATMKGFAAVNSVTVATNSDTITLNRTTTGSVTVGEWLQVEDVAANTWLVKGVTSSTGTEATPFSAAV